MSANVRPVAPRCGCNPDGTEHCDLCDPCSAGGPWCQPVCEEPCAVVCAANDSRSLSAAEVLLRYVPAEPLRYALRHLTDRELARAIGEVRTNKPPDRPNPPGLVIAIEELHRRVSPEPREDGEPS